MNNPLLGICSGVYTPILIIGITLRYLWDTKIGGVSSLVFLLYTASLNIFYSRSMSDNIFVTRQFTDATELVILGYPPLQWIILFSSNLMMVLAWESSVKFLHWTQLFTLKSWLHIIPTTNKYLRLVPRTISLCHVSHMIISEQFLWMEMVMPGGAMWV